MAKNKNLELADKIESHSFMRKFTDEEMPVMNL